MASSQKKTKKTTKPAETKTSRRRKETAPAPEPKRTYRREIGAAVCLLLALCVAVSYFSADAFFLAIFATVLKGSFGYGYWAVAIVLAVAGVNLLRHRDRPVTLRTVCTLLLPLIVGVAYEINRFVGRHDNWFTRIITGPGMWFQNFTTNEPDDSMLEVGITALEAVLPENEGDDRW